MPSVRTGPLLHKLRPGAQTQADGGKVHSLHGRSHSQSIPHPQHGETQVVVVHVGLGRVVNFPEICSQTTKGGELDQVKK